jgi:3-phenylpropionate/trans-cinnamate dioxygenase ferredoxin component
MWVRVCRSDQVTPDEPMAVTVKDREIGIFRVADRLYAIDNICSHEYASLTKGFVEGTVVECPLHLAQFCLKTGQCLKGPATAPVTTFQVAEADGQVSVLIGE